MTSPIPDVHAGMPTEPTDQPTLPAGDVTSWLAATQAALAGAADAAVPCDGCTACCTSAQFVHIAPDETDTLAHVPAELCFPAPLAPPGHLVLAHDEHGRCPMLGDSGCSIYPYRPRACRTYDCRVLAAAGLVPDEPATVEIARRVGRWRFGVGTERDRTTLAAIRAAARWLDQHDHELPDRLRPTTATQRAVLAVEVHAAFLDRRDGRPTVVTADDADVRRAVDALGAPG
ncbi:MAG: YkgJ family cysteine cluster protein [Acidimicrobiales bacterium]